MWLFISILIILTVFFIYQYVTFIRVYYVGQSIHKFRELRTEVAIFLSANVKTQLSFEEAIKYQQFLMSLNAIIKYFDLLHPELIKFSTVRSLPSKLLYTSEKLTSDPQNGSIPGQYKEKIKECYLTLFKAIPFCRFRVYIFFLRLVATLSIKLGIGRYKKKLNTIEKLSKLEKDIQSGQSLPCNP
ncbi:hypothetical protein [Niastella populi]|uniref:Uncharacterized protein n=1 Tax=Niastella populi TaxID=550983 RepID=A0A1V9FE03_9BACT|nr:hypothetical protein [Niastella populi]OQP56542.1 hypothetical protein A4R26_05105 [Niastella populi]